MKNLILLAAGAILITTYSHSRGAQLELEPIYGVERTARAFPSPAKTTTKTVFGARATYGVDHLKAELEYTQGTNDENGINFSGNTYSVKERTKKGMLGLRSSYRMLSILNWTLRAGVRALESKVESTDQSGNILNNDTPIEYDPYAGALLTIKGNKGLGKIGITVGATVVFTNGIDGFLEDDEYDVQYTIGANLGFGNARF